MPDGALRRGDLVEVRSAGEILATLDAAGADGAMPFMPEMLSYLGRRFTVSARCDKICDTIGSTLQSRRLPDTVLLDDLRCDGAAHGGCQAECRIYWKGSWLKRVESLDGPVADPDPDDLAALSARIAPHVRTADAGDDENSGWKCQATEANRASYPLSTMNPRPYVNELRNGNVGPVQFTKVMVRASYMQPLHHFGYLKFKNLHWPGGTNVKSPPAPEPLDLQPGDWVRVKPLEDIEDTLTIHGNNRGLHFDIEMIPFCGEVFQVRGRVTHIIEEHTGKMLRFGSDCIKLDGAVCSGERSTGRFFCPRKIYPYWREAWLERVDAPVPSAT